MQEDISQNIKIVLVGTTRKPDVQGPQTAVVVGPVGEEIYTDEYGRIKVQFHWDRHGKGDENHGAESTAAGQSEDFPRC